MFDHVLRVAFNKSLQQSNRNVQSDDDMYVNNLCFRALFPVLHNFFTTLLVICSTNISLGKDQVFPMNVVDGSRGGDVLYHKWFRNDTVPWSTTEILYLSTSGSIAPMSKKSQCFFF